MNQRRGLVESY